MAKRSAGDPRTLIAELLENLRTAPAHLPPALRQAIQARAGAAAGFAADGPAEIPADLYELIDKIAERATEVTDEDFAALAARGYTLDQQFEIVLAASLGASHARLRRGLDALDLALAQTNPEA